MFTGSWPYSFDGHFNVYVFGCVVAGGASKHTLAGRGGHYLAWLQTLMPR